LYPNDFLGSAKVGMMTTEEIGAYLLLLLLDWQEDGFDYQAPRLARWCRLPTARFTKAWAAIGPCFTADAAGRLRNPRLERERLKQADWREKSRKGAAKTNEKRAAEERQSERGGARGGDGMAHANGSPTGSPNGRTPFPSPFPSPVTTTAPTGIAPVGASRDLPVADAPQPVPEPPAPPKPSPYPKFVAQFGDRWAALVGKPDFGRIAGDLKDLHRVHGPTVLMGALENFARHRSIAVAQGTTRPDGWPQFVADFADYIPKRGAAA
jgi:uncharacterized protein YdaU (DUF1376 family)